MKTVIRISTIVGVFLCSFLSVADTRLPTKIHRFVAQASYEANAYWVETPTGMVLIDALMLKSDARQLVAVLKTTGKPLDAILLTHPHVDHFGGIKTIVDAFGGKTKVIATAATANAVASVHAQALSSWASALGEDFEQVPYLPNTIVAPGETISLAGLNYQFTDLGSGEAPNNSVIKLVEHNALFTGDATVAHGVFYVGEGRASSASAALTKLGSLFAPDMRVYSGHYAPAKLSEIVQQNLAQIHWLSEQLSPVLNSATLSDVNKTLSKEAKTTLIKSITSYYAAQGLADYGIPHAVLAQMNVDGFITQYLSELKQKTTIKEHVK